MQIRKFSPDGGRSQAEDAGCVVVQDEAGGFLVEVRVREVLEGLLG